MGPSANRSVDEKAVDVTFADFSASSTPTTAATSVDGSVTSPEANEAINDERPSIGSPSMNRFRLLAIALLNFTNGLCDSAAGALIPSMEKHYSLGYMIVSLIFVGQALGYIFAAPIIDSVRQRFGRANTLMYTQLLLTIGLIPLTIEAPYPFVVLSFFIFGLCESFNLAIGNVFCGSLSNGTTALGIMHGAYGIGGTVGPLIATSLVAVAKVSWGYYYFIPGGFAVINIWVSGWSFNGYEEEIAERQSSDPVRLMESGKAEAINNTQTTAAASAIPTLYGILSRSAIKVVLLGALFLFAYQGAEVSISGWVISFLLDTRHGERDKVGYVTSGFWAGITLGRFLLSIPAQWIGEKRFVYIVTSLAAMFQVILWVVPNVIGDSVAVGLLGFLLGPIYPCAAAVFMRGLDKQEQVLGMVIMSAFGSSGGAVAPFTTGLLAQAVGTFVLNPIAISLFGVMLICWFCVPGKPRIMG
ncbi:major facilitator superfamily transporter [Naviculisporaceae sp. PSN 640]